MVIKKFTSAEFDNVILDGFSEEVREDKNKKLPYGDWWALRNWVKEHDSFAFYEITPYSYVLYDFESYEHFDFDKGKYKSFISYIRQVCKPSDEDVKKETTIEFTVTYDQFVNLGKEWKKALDNCNWCHKNEKLECNEHFDVFLKNSETSSEFLIFIDLNNRNIQIHNEIGNDAICIFNAETPIEEYKLYDIIISYVDEYKHLNIMPWRAGRWKELPASDSIIYRINSSDWRRIIDKYIGVKVASQLFEAKDTVLMKRGRMMSYEDIKYTLAYSPFKNILAVYAGWSNEACTINNLNFICPSSFVEWAKSKKYIYKGDNGLWYMSFGNSIESEVDILANQLSAITNAAASCGNTLKATADSLQNSIYSAVDFPFNLSTISGTYATTTSELNYSPLTTTGTVSNMYSKADKAYLTYDNTCFNNNINKDDSVKKEKEEKKMKNFNFDFGFIDNNTVRMSMYGLAVQNVDRNWVAYNKDSGEIMDVDILNFNFDKAFFKMPCAIKDVNVGDVIIHQRRPMFVVETYDNQIWAIDPVAGERKNIMLTKSPFGFDFVTRIISLFDGFMNNMEAATSDNPFGGMLPFMLMGEGMNKDNMLMAMMMMNGKMDMSNPMMMMLFMSDKAENDDLMKMMFLGQMMNNQK